jgi:hypothetical protein
MTVALKPGLAPGRYLVTWRTYDDSDGAIFGDCYTLFVGQAAADAAVSSQYRLDAGTDCQRIDVESNAGTPTASQVSALATQAAAPEEEAASSSDSSGGGGSDVPVWALIVGIGGGLVAGLVGGRLISNRSS